MKEEFNLTVTSPGYSSNAKRDSRHLLIMKIVPILLSLMNMTVKIFNNPHKRRFAFIVHFFPCFIAVKPLIIIKVIVGGVSAI